MSEIPFYPEKDMSEKTAEALVRLEELARSCLSGAGSISIKMHRNRRWEVTVYRNCLEHHHYEGESLLDALAFAWHAEKPK